MPETGSRISVKVSPRGFLVNTYGTGHSSDWMDAGSVFTAEVLRRKYAQAEVSCFTPSVTLVPKNFHIPGNERLLLSSVASVTDEDTVYTEMLPEQDAVLVWSPGAEAPLAGAVVQTLKSSGCPDVRLVPEILRLLRLMPDLSRYNKVLCSYDGHILSLVVAEGRTLRLCSTFRADCFTTAEYWIFDAVKSFQFNMEVTDLFFATPLGEDEEISLCSYFRSVEMVF
ncbi:MAG: DUF3822 family protein [Candidatus Cryptobacteroides sp.]